MNSGNTSLSTFYFYVCIRDKNGVICYENVIECESFSDAYEEACQCLEYDDQEITEISLRA